MTEQAAPAADRKPHARMDLTQGPIAKTMLMFSLPVLGDPTRKVTDADLRGEAYLLNVWGSWCPGCRDEHPVITQLAQSGRIKVIGYDYKDEPEDAKRWLEQFGNPYALVIADQDGRAAFDWGIYGAPESFLVDKDGIVRWKYIGPMTDAVVREQLLPELETLK